MPTSSQALILINADGTGSSARLAFGRKSSADVFPCSLSKINMDTYFMLVKVPAEDIRLNKSSAGKSSSSAVHEEISPDTHRSILTYDIESDSFQWKLVPVLGQKNTSSRQKKPDTEAKSRTAKKEEQMPKVSSRPSSGRSNEIESKFSLFSVNAKVYERLTNLGFRPRSAENVTQNRKRNAVVQVSGTESGPELKGWRRPNDESLAFVDNVEFLHTEESPTAYKIRDRLKSESNDGSDEEIDEETVKSLIDDLKTPIGSDRRIKPSVHMRKRKPRERPLTVVLSLRDNDEFSHAEVKSIVEKLGGVTVTELQYDPLPVRACEPDMNSRWYVTVSSKEEAERLVKKGFVVGEDKIIVYNFDDVMRREVATYKFYESICDAQKRLKRKRSSGHRKT